MNEIHEDLKAAIECSIYHAPREPGLTYQELIEAGTQLGYQRGELGDAISLLGRATRTHGGRIQLPPHALFTDFLMSLEHEYRDPNAFECIVQQLRDLVKAVGRDRARIARSTLVAQGAARGVPEAALEVAVTMYLLEGNLLQDKEGLLHFAPGREGYAMPSQQINQARDFVRKRPRMPLVYEVVRDVIKRRSDGRPPSAEPIAAFEARLDELGHGRFRIWWTRTASELRLCNGAVAPTAVCVLAAALAEAALTFVVGRARALNLATMNSKTFAESPTQWKFDDLLKSAAAGGADAILDQRMRDRADRLNSVRQRIHAGKLMAETPSGPIPDIRPEEPREAVETLDAILRRVLEWLDAHTMAKAAP